MKLSFVYLLVEDDTRRLYLVRIVVSVSVRYVKIFQAREN